MIPFHEEQNPCPRHVAGYHSDEGEATYPGYRAWAKANEAAGSIEELEQLQEAA